MGQPEVNIGLLPGGGGVVRLPKAAGLKNALDIIVTGNHVMAEQALKMDIIDTVIIFSHALSSSVSLNSTKCLISTNCYVFRLTQH